MNKFEVNKDEEFIDKYAICLIDNDGFCYVDVDIAEQLHISLKEYEDVLKKNGAIVMHNAYSQWFEDTRYLFNTEFEAKAAIKELKNWKVEL